MEQQTAHRIISCISEGVIATPDIVEYFKLEMNEEIQDKAHNWYQRIKNLPFSNASLLRLVTGTFGVGKTHFMYHIERLLQNLNDKEDTLVIWVNLRDLQEPNDFQYLLFRGLKTIGGDHLSAWNGIYNRLADKVILDRKVTQSQRYALIYQIIDAFFDGAEAISNLSIPSKFVSLPILNLLRNKSKQRLKSFIRAEQFGTNALKAYQKGFLDSLLAFGEGRVNYDDFDLVSQNINKNANYGNLIDLMFRLFWLAGYKRVVVFVDEFERIDTREGNDEIIIRSQWTRNILNHFFRFYDDSVLNAGKTYPPIAQILAMPDNLYSDVLARADPALRTRFDNSDKMELGIVGIETAKNSNLIEKIIQLFQYAGYSLDLDAIRRGRNEIWQSIYHELELENQNKMPEHQELATLRYLLPRLTAKISQNVR